MQKIRLTGFECPKCKKKDKLILIYDANENRKIICDKCGEVTW
jgi:Zn ribbon nucleic-acid-binding protein